MTQSVHAGHRDRLKQRFLEQGLDGFTDVQALELLLFYGIPRQDTNPIAHRLLDHFGSLSQVLEASPEELTRVGGIKEHSAVLLNLINQMGRLYLVDRAKRERVLPTGSTKMYQDLKKIFWWPGMKRGIAEFVASCLTCQKVKVERQRPAGLLRPLEILEWKWDSITMDFVVSLPKTPQTMILFG